MIVMMSYKYTKTESNAKKIIFRYQKSYWGLGEVYFFLTGIKCKESSFSLGMPMTIRKW